MHDLVWDWLRVLPGQILSYPSGVLGKWIGTRVSNQPDKNPVMANIIIYSTESDEEDTLS